MSRRMKVVGYYKTDEFECTGVATFIQELYGADIDGNRGELRWMLDDVDEDTVEILNQVGEVVTNEVKELDEHLFDEICYKIAENACK